MDVQRAAVMRSFSAGVAKASSASAARSPHMYQVKVEHELYSSVLGADDHALSVTHPSPATSTVTASPSVGAPSPYGFMPHATADAMEDTVQPAEDDNLFAAYSAESHPQDLDDPDEWDYYYVPAPLPTPVTPSSVNSSAAMPPRSAPFSSALAAINNASATAVGRATARGSTSTRSAGVRQGVKRPLATTTGTGPLPSPTVTVASSMIAMRNHPDALDLGSAPKAPTKSTPARSTARATASRRVKKDDSSSSSGEAEQPPTKKTKVSRERQLKINAASRRCRKKQKLELQFLRTHVVELQSALKDQLLVMRGSNSQQQRFARLASFLEDSIHKVDEMSSGGRPTTPKATVFTESELQQLKAVATVEPPAAIEPAPTVVSQPEAPSGYEISEERKKTLLNIASFMRNNISLESQSFSPEVISCLPIEMDGWQLRLAITEKNYTIHNCKFFPCNVRDMYDFCWETNVASKVSIKQGKEDFCVVTPLDTDVAHVYSKTIGKWSLSVHGVPNVTYNSLVCRVYNPEQKRAIICQQSVLEDRDFEDESTIPWLFKRWVVFQPRVVDGVEGTFVEAYRTASYATGRLIYKEDNTYDSFCEHLIRRYAESNALLERMMARDSRFQHFAGLDLAASNDAALDPEETTSDRMVKDLLLF
ncbi:hypothetical protein Poli38472_005716 [Pythium oligandrum]|uniref:BZIP domain-containing protein n=1 Tax=Pythium oligandrum TaxID=41045 RepID=A0A8K1FS60_PYTOL|nr:hypothetical protein Poli38472_005716 [Pythium oligandrum]|eukprot:TMW68248.1 hypothetical protein Poli38472_005716 [Pythium oligandrum]